MRKSKGFSLIELLIVVAIILVIAAIAIPNLMKSKMAANESSAVGSIRTITTSELTYATVNPTSGYTTLANLGSAGLIDTTLAGGTKSGFTFTAGANGTTTTQFLATAAPVTPGTTGNNYYCSSESAVIKIGSATFTYTTCTDQTTGAPLGN
jgi:prepilin-type N-terminal cleavage/methylation domain-containing protein